MRLSLLSPLDALIAPPARADRVQFLGTQAFAHRGLHSKTLLENSRAAFQAAIERGLGIELDIQPAAGGEPFVFHDSSLDRLTDETGRFAARTAAELSQIKLKGMNETIPRLAEILRLVAGRVPILIEVKTNATSPQTVGTLAMAVRREMEGYRGQVGVMSFNPHVGAWFAEHAPRVARGLVVTEEKDGRGWSRIKGRLARHIALWRAKPVFLAYDIRDLPSSFAASQRKRGLKLLTWTVRTAEQERTALECADEIIFEQADPRG